MTLLPRFGHDSVAQIFEHVFSMVFVVCSRQSDLSTTFLALFPESIFFITFLANVPQGLSPWHFLTDFFGTVLPHLACC